MDIKLIGHVAGEAIVIGGVLYYAKKRSDDLEERVAVLEKQLLEHAQMIGMMRNALSGIVQPVPRPPPQPDPTPAPEPPRKRGPSRQQLREKKEAERILKLAKQEAEELVFEDSKTNSASSNED